ncbi:MAG TPA: hypothetical protein G4O11_11750 [Anaerolineae bacterium]|nr:hypothetical protein [Anaerolineae bacterium]
MKRSNVFVLITGLVSLAANVLAILSYLSEEDPFFGWRPDRGLLTVLTFVLLAYCLAMWSTLTRRWVHRHRQGPKRGARYTATFLLNGLIAFPLLTLWLHLLFSVVIFTEVSSTERWFLAMGFAWGVTPFTALGLLAMGEILGPLLTSKE